MSHIKYYLFYNHLRICKFNIVNIYISYPSRQDSLLLFLFVTKSKVNKELKETHIFRISCKAQGLINVKWECKEKAN